MMEQCNPFSKVNEKETGESSPLFSSLFLLQSKINIITWQIFI